MSEPGVPEGRALRVTRWPVTDDPGDPIMGQIALVEPIGNAVLDSG
jgi:hypothetical protein